MDRRFSKRRGKNELIALLWIAAMVAGLAVVLVYLSGSRFDVAFGGFLRGISGSSYAVAEVFVKATPLILAGLGVSFAFQSGFISIGAEGQLYIGAIAATAVALSFPDLPRPLLLTACFLLSFLSGGVWSLIPGVLKAKFGISEVINTIMFNYIAIGIVGITLQTVLKDPANYFPVSPDLPKSAELSVLIPGTRLHSGFLIAIACALVSYVLIYYTAIGFKVRAVGMNPRACQCAGVSVAGTILFTSMVSGGLAGIAGFVEITGLHHHLIEGISPGYGYLAVIVALLGKNHPSGIIVSGLAISAIQVGSLSMQRAGNVPSAISSIILGAIVLLLMAKDAFISALEKKEEEGVA